MEKLEKNSCNLPLVFAEMFKDEINANDENKMYNGIKRITKKYSEDKKAFSIINEFTRVISGGTSLDEIFQLTRDEIVHPTLISDISAENNCHTDK